MANYEWIGIFCHVIKVPDVKYITKAYPHNKYKACSQNENNWIKIDVMSFESLFTHRGIQ